MQVNWFINLLALAGIAACAPPSPAAKRGTASVAAPAVAAPVAAASPVATMPSQPREQTADQQVLHALSRLTFGARPGEVERVRAVGVDRWIDQQLSPARIDDRTAEQFVSRFDALSMTSAQLADAYRPLRQARRRAQQDSAADRMALRQAAEENRTVQAQLPAAVVGRALLSERQLKQVMVAFWENHFSVFQRKQTVRFHVADYDRTIREHALGNFRNLLGAVARHPAMLIYLDNARSAVEPGRPTLQPAGRGRARRGLNENYARELLELHTLGVDGGYTQQDVIEVARAFTGWTVEQQYGGGNFVFRPAIHDAGTKTVLGNVLPSGRGIDDGEQVLDIVARHPATARFIATKVARRFVSDTPPPVLVDRAAAVFTRTNGDIREVVRTIVTSSEFFSQAAYRSKVKTPFELAVSTLRALGAQPDSTGRTAMLVARLGQPLFGKETPNGFPDVASGWLNTGSILARINFGTMVASGAVPGVSLDRWPVTNAVRNASREAQVDAVIASLLGGAASPDTRAILLTGRNPYLDANASAATEIAAADTSASGTPIRRLPRLDGFAAIVGLALGSPEFQRR